MSIPASPSRPGVVFVRGALAPLVVSTLAAVSMMACGTSSNAPGEPAERTETAASSDGGSESGAGAQGTHVAVHGMVLFGSQRIYLSHIPLFSSPHNIQVVVEVAIASGVPAAQQQFGNKLFTVRPNSAFSLHDLAHGFLPGITGTIYLGNFESGGTPAHRNVKFDVMRVIFQRAMSASTPRSPSLDYLAVGTPSQAFLVHIIDAPPSFDQIVSVDLDTNSWLDAPSLELGTLVKIPGRPNAVASRLAANAVVDAVKLQTSSFAADVSAPDSSLPGDAGATTSTSIAVKKENSCLLGSDFFNPCPAAP